MDDVVAPLGMLATLPLELRLKVYSCVFEGQLIHCCSGRERYTSHSGGYQASRACQVTNGDRMNFMYRCVKCSESDFLAIRSTATKKWCSKTHSPAGSSNFQSSDILALLLCCRRVWQEAEPLVYEQVTFNVGLPQFGAFYEQFLKRPRSHPVTAPRGSLMTRLSITFPNESHLASATGHYYLYRHLDTFLWVTDMIEVSVRDLTTLPKLKHLSVTLAASILQSESDAKVLPDYYFDILTRFRGLEGLSISFLGALSPEVEGGARFEELDDSDALKQKVTKTCQKLEEVMISPRTRMSTLNS